MIVAIDPSLRATAIAVGSDAINTAHSSFGSANVGDTVADRIARYEDQVGRIMDWLEGFTPIDAVFIEAYSFGSNDARAKFSAEYGGILRWNLCDLTKRIYEVAPATLKKFATGKGAGPKDMIAAHLTKRYGVMLSTNDEFDAYGLYRLGLVAEGIDTAQCQAQREAVATVLKSHRERQTA